MKVHFKLNLAKSDSDGHTPIVHHALWKNYKFQFYTSERILPKFGMEWRGKMIVNH